jgi:hypothetical protein
LPFADSREWAAICRFFLLCSNENTMCENSERVQNVYVVAQANSHIAFVDSTSAWRRGAFWPENYDLACPHPICHYTHYTPLRERGVQPRRSAAAAAAPTFLFAPLRRGVAFEHNFPRAVPSGLLSQWKCAPRTYRSIWNCLADEGIASFRSAPHRRLINWLTYLGSGCLKLCVLAFVIFVEMRVTSCVRARGCSHMSNWDFICCALWSWQEDRWGYHALSRSPII